MVISPPVGNRTDTVLLNGMPLTVYRRKGVRQITYATRLAEVEGRAARRTDDGVLHDSFESGGGYSYRVPGVAGYSHALRATGRWGRSLIPGPQMTQIAMPGGFTSLGEITGSWVYPDISGNNNIYFVCGRHIIYLDTGNPPALHERDLGSGSVAESAIVFNRDAYVGINGSPMQQRTDGGTWNVAPAGLVRRQLGKVYWVAQMPDGRIVGSYRLLGTGTNGYDFYYVDVASNELSAANWVGPINIGDGSYRAKVIATANRHAYFATSGGLFDVDERGYTPNLTPYHEESGDINNGRAALYHEGFVYIAHGYGLDRVDVSQPARQDAAQWCQPGAPPLPYEGPMGPPTALTSDQGWVVASFYIQADDESHIWWGRDKRDMGLPAMGPMVWHGPEIVLDGRVTHMRIITRSGSVPRMYIGVWVGGAPLLYTCYLEPGRGPIRAWLENSSTYKWHVSTTAQPSEVILSEQDWDDAAAKKVLVAHELQADNLGNGVEVPLQSRADGGDWEDQGTFDESPEQEISPPDDALIGYQVGTKLELVGTNTNPPIVRAYKHRASVKPARREARAYQVLIGPAQFDFGGPDGRDPVKLWNDLQDLEESGPVQFRDELGVLYQAVVESVAPSSEIEDEATGMPVRVATLELTLLRRVRR